MNGRWWARALLAGLLGVSLQAPQARDRKSPAPPARQVTDESVEDDAVGPTLPRARVLLEDASSGAVREVEVEVAATPRARSRGLMGREELAAGQGMLFVFADEEVQTFWMRNTLIPLDMVFINSAGRIVGIIESAAPRSLVRRQVGVPGRYVLEVPGGWCRKMGVLRGGKVRFQGLEDLEVIP